jgi:(p)ppGpp synthase/HD superfamily hydrolase
MRRAAPATGMIDGAPASSNAEPLAHEARHTAWYNQVTMAIFTGRVEQAIALALRAHEVQVRKGDGQLPYAVHPVTVALILSRYSGDEDTIIAGLLHDTIEDTLVTAEEIEREFGPKVRDMVLDVTESRLPNLSWETRKARYLRRLQTAPRPSLLIAGADKIANLVSMIAAHASAGDALWERFHTSPGEKLGFYRQVHAVIQTAWPTCPLLQELGNRLEEAERKLGARL